MAAPTFVAAGPYLSEGGGSSANIGAPSGVQAGDIVLIVLYHEHEGGAATPSSVPSGFTEIHSEHTTGDVSHSRLYWKRSSGSEPSSYNFSFSNSNWRTGYSVAFRGCVSSGDPVDAFDGNTSGSNNSGSSAPAVSLTTTGPDRMLVYFCSNYVTTAWTLPSGFTAFEPAGKPSPRCILGGGYQVQAAAGSTGSLVATGSHNGVRTAHVLALKPDETASSAPRRLFLPF